MLRTLLQPALFFYSCSARSCHFLHLPSKVLSFFSMNKKKKRNAALLEKVLICRESSLFQKKKKKPKLDDLDLTFLLTLQELQPALFSAAAARAFFCCCSAKSARSCPSGRFSLLAAASRFCCSIHGNFSASRIKSQILQPCDPGLILPFKFCLLCVFF